ncbi:carbon-monoxide dehydrogenase small subunit [Streptomyces sp. Amel2xB2]|uniref:(2Fe-2S)-binding protein n=1 Tax=Streptomyces TaxID=1883 RepID=UPI00099FC772|nr:MULTISPECIES: (2Fe-2S)-binding protein [Streptomyces]RAJ70377.1 carbon-monoxide dehydrogenase small subunit [Streptomyces sp. Amel2xB2]
MTDDVSTPEHPVRQQQLISLHVNGEAHELLTEPRRTLVDVLRHDLRLTGTHVGCEHGICGACTVLLDGAPVRACLMFAAQAEGSEIRTVESLADGGGLGDLQRAFSEHHGLQCGFCTPGFLMLAEGFLAERPEASKEEIREVVASNLCRCTGYQTIVEAIDDCAARRRAALRARVEGTAHQDENTSETVPPRAACEEVPCGSTTRSR